MIMTRTENYAWNHNGDFSGEVKVILTARMYDILAAAERFRSHGPEQMVNIEVSIEFEDLKELVMEYVKRERVNAIEQESDPDKVFGLK